MAATTIGHAHIIDAHVRFA